MTPSPAHTLVDLAALRGAVSSVIAWYEDFLAGRSPPLADLDVAVHALGALPPMGGRLGRALALVASGGRHASTEETIAALEILRASAGLRRANPGPRPAGAITAVRTVPSCAPRPEPQRHHSAQLQLPGMDQA